ncbi:MAG TPA: ATP-dependent DNA helicase PcrA, partial [Cellulomonas sp.]
GYVAGGYGSGGSGPRTAGSSSRSGSTSAPRAGSSAPRPSGGATFGSATPRPEGTVPDLSLGDRVTHDAYGLGTVVGLESSGPNAVAKVDFGTEGTKRLLLRFSPVTKL